MYLSQRSLTSWGPAHSIGTDGVDGGTGCVSPGGRRRRIVRHVAANDSTTGIRFTGAAWIDGGIAVLVSMRRQM